MIKSFDEFLNEDLNFTTSESGDCKLSARWFYYNPDDDIIYGSDNKPVGDNILFAFNPISCIFIMNGEEKRYDVSDPIILIKYDIDKDEVVAYTNDVIDYLKSLGFSGNSISSKSSENEINDIFDEYDDIKYLLIYENKLVASTFDVIEEN